MQRKGWVTGQGEDDGGHCCHARCLGQHPRKAVLVPSWDPAMPPLLPVSSSLAICSSLLPVLLPGAAQLRAALHGCMLGSVLGASTVCAPQLPHTSLLPHVGPPPTLLNINPVPSEACLRAGVPKASPHAWPRHV